MLWRRPISFLPLLLVLCILALCPWNQVSAQNTGSLVGQVMLPGGGHASRVLVSLEFRGSPIQTMYTSDEGRFSFYQLMHNMYHVVIREKDYYPVDKTIVVRPDLNPITYVSIVLRPIPKDSSDQEAPPEPVAGGNPHMVTAESYRKKFPPQAVKEFEAGVKEAEKGKTEKALKRYQKAVELAPGFYPAHNNMGTIYLAQKNFEEAEQAFREVIRLNQADANAYFNLGNVFYLTRRYGEAERTIREGLLREALSPLGNYLLGALLMRAGDLAEAERLLLKALSLDGGMAVVYLELANLYLLQERKAEAIAQLHHFVELFPRDPMIPKAKEVLARLEKPAPTAQ